MLSAALFGLTVIGAPVAQQSTPRPIDTLDLDLRGQAGDSPILLLAGSVVAPAPLAGFQGMLAVDLASAAVIPVPGFNQRGRSSSVFHLPPGLLLHESVPLFAQIAMSGPGGSRLLPPFQVFGNRVAERGALGDPGQTPAMMPEAPALAPMDDRSPVAMHRVSRPGVLRLSIDLRPNGSGAASGGRNGRVLGSGAQAAAAGPAPDSSSMSDLSIVSAEDSREYPRRMACRLTITYPDGTTAQGSGAMIDAFHVITAGHCVYDHDYGGYATSILVEPAYDIHRANPTPFGTASWTDADPVLIWSEWVSRRRHKHDIAVIRVDRAVGGLTSWFGTGWSSSCSTYKDNNFYAGSYPSESHTGVDMYWRYGEFDACPNGYETRFRKDGYGGESGSGYYRITSGGNRRIHGVLSHTSWTIGHGRVSDVVRLGEDKYDEVNDFIDDNRPSGTDLIPLGVDPSSTSIVRGSSVDVDFTILNYGETDFSGAYSYRIVLSTDSVIDSSDTILANPVVIGASFPAYDTKEISRSVTIPSSLARGSYYMGVLLSSSDSVTSNNATGQQDLKLVTLW